nr:spore coat protein U domain-containing protein [Serratia symbiotica]
MADSKTAIIGISATVVSACEAGSTSSGNYSFGSLNFGALYSLSSAVSAASQQNAGAIRVKCNNGTSYTGLAKWRAKRQYRSTLPAECYRSAGELQPLYQCRSQHCLG